MLLQFTVENYKSFRDEAVLSLIPGSGTEHTDNVINKGKEKALKSVIILGANASGKSNVTKAIRNATVMIRESASIQLGSPLSRIIPFKLDDVSSAKPTRFEFVFETEGVRYVYGFSATVERITKEYLYAYYSARPTTIFERTEDEYIFKNDKKLLESLASKNNPNKLFLATATAWNYERTKAPYLWFANSIDTYVGNSWSRDYPAFINDSGGVQKRFTSKLLEIADINISDYQARETDIRKAFSVHTNHIINEGEKKTDYTLDLMEESAGTRNLFFMSTHIKKAFETGKTMVVDELEAGLHPLLLEEIIKMFHDPDININNAQLIFTAHAVSLLDPDIFRRDQIYFTEKDMNSAASELYSLDEFPVRKSENIRKGYLVGRYGALPAIREGLSPWS
jgi:AAA15 family ATPase/GTPase